MKWFGLSNDCILTSPSTALLSLDLLSIAPISCIFRSAQWRSGNAMVCKTIMHGFDSRLRLQVFLRRPHAVD